MLFTREEFIFIWSNSILCLCVFSFFCAIARGKGGFIKKKLIHMIFKGDPIKKTENTPS